MSMVYLNGEYLPAEQAKVSVFDRGFLLGDGVYEVIPAYAGNLFRLQHHMQRLQASLNSVRMKNPLSFDEWEVMLKRLVTDNYEPNLSIYLQVTRGVAIRDHAFPQDVTPSVFAMVNSIQPLPEKYYTQGVSAITVEDIRWQRCDIKSISLLANVLLRQQAVDQQVAESILLRNGLVTEGAASNVFAVINNEICTPPKGQFILLGITRDLILELAAEHDMVACEREISRDELLAAAEIWLSSSTKEILPVTHINQQPVGDGKPGPLWLKLSTIYREYKNSLIDKEVPIGLAD